MQVSSGCLNVQHLRHSAGIGMNCLTGNISWPMMTSLGSSDVLKKSVTVFSEVLLPSRAGAVNRCTSVTPCSASRNKMSSSESWVGTFRITPLSEASDMARLNLISNCFSTFCSRCFLFCDDEVGYTLSCP